MEKLGIVIKSEDDFAEVIVQRTSACTGGCKTCSGCETPNLTISLPNEIGAQAGDVVQLIGNSTSVIKYTFLMYVLPLMVFIISIVFSYNYMASINIENHELYSFLIGVIAFFLSYLFVRQVDKRKDITSEIIKMDKIIDLEENKGGC